MFSQNDPPISPPPPPFLLRVRCVFLFLSFEHIDRCDIIWSATVFWRSLLYFDGCQETILTAFRVQTTDSSDDDDDWLTDWLTVPVSRQFNFYRRLMDERRHTAAAAASPSIDRIECSLFKWLRTKKYINIHAWAFVYVWMSAVILFTVCFKWWLVDINVNDHWRRWLPISLMSRIF